MTSEPAPPSAFYVPYPTLLSIRAIPQYSTTAIAMHSATTILNFNWFNLSRFAISRHGEDRRKCLPISFRHKE